MELKITKDKVLAAASKCSAAKETLKTLFPEVFKPEPLNVSKFRGEIGNDYENIIEKRNGGDLKNLGFYLNSKYTWKIVKEIDGIQVLQMYKK